MSVTVRPYVNGGWEVDIRVQLPDGSVCVAQAPVTVTRRASSWRPRCLWGIWRGRREEAVGRQ